MVFWNLFPANTAQRLQHSATVGLMRKRKISGGAKDKKKERAASDKEAEAAVRQGGVPPSFGSEGCRAGLASTLHERYALHASRARLPITVLHPPESGDG